MKEQLHTEYLIQGQKNCIQKEEWILQKNVTSKVDINTGIEYEFNGYNIGGTVPVYSYNLKADAPALNISSEENSGRAGVYVESQIKLSKSFHHTGYQVRLLFTFRQSRF